MLYIHPGGTPCQEKLFVIWCIRHYHMVHRRYSVSQYPLVNRKRFVSSLANELVEPFDRLSKETRIPKSRLLDIAIEDLLKKYEKRNG